MNLDYGDLGMNVLEKLKGKVIVSSQAAFDEPLYQEECMLAMMKSVVTGGAAGLRVAGTRDVANAKKYFSVPVIGLTKPKVLPENWKEIVYITPTLEDVKSLINAGADIIAFDSTLRPHNGCDLHDIINEIHNSQRLAMADISTFEEGVYAEKCGADIISTTLAGYTVESGKPTEGPDFQLLAKLVSNIKKPVFLEGRIWELSEVKKAFELGAYSVVIGSAITRPQLITKRFCSVTK